MRARLETYLSTQSAGVLKLATQVRFRRPLHRRSPQRDAQDIGMAMNPHWVQGFPRRPRRRLGFSAATRTQARERSRLAGAIRSHSSDRDGYARTGRRAGSAGACAHVLRSWRRHRAALGAGRPESAADHETGARCRHRRTGRRMSAGHGVYQIRLPPSGLWSTIAARPRAESRGYPGQLEGNGPYLVALRSPGQAPGGPGTRPRTDPRVDAVDFDRSRTGR